MTGVTDHVAPADGYQPAVFPDAGLSQTCGAECWGIRHHGSDILTRLNLLAIGHSYGVGVWTRATNYTDCQTSTAVGANMAAEGMHQSLQQDQELGCCFAL